MLDCLLARLHTNNAGLLTVLNRPEIQLHTVGSERDIGLNVTRRKISGAPPPRLARRLPRAYACAAKLGLPFWDYLGNRLEVPD